MKNLRDSIPIRRKYTRNLRENMTEAEHRLWHYLRRKNLGGYRFRRQHPVAKDIVDFACVASKIAVEVDGATHGAAHEISYDARRTEFLENLGWRVVRYGNEEIYKNIEDVLDDLYAYLKGVK